MQVFDTGCDCDLLYCQNDYVNASLKRKQISAIEIEFPADMKWFKANINGTGFYRVSLSKIVFLRR
jgi:hypothetical protein